MSQSLNSAIPVIGIDIGKKIIPCRRAGWAVMPLAVTHRAITGT